MRIGLVSLGCPKNLVDAEVMLGLAEQAGHEITSEADTADVLVVNTCAFIDRAKQESIDTILEMAELKKQAAGRRLIVTGCLAERYRDELQAEIPEIDAVLGTGEVPRILELLSPTVHGHRPTVSPLTFYSHGPHSVLPHSPRSGESQEAPSAEPPALRQAQGAPSSSRGERDLFAEAPDDNVAARGPRDGEAVAPVFGLDLPTYIYGADTPRRLATPPHYAYLKIAEGCDYKCAFCIIPKMRGHYRSRPAESIVQEATRLGAGGVKEVLLISQDTTFYGIDRGERGALAPLLRQLDRIDTLTWIRLLYLYPTTITDEVIEAVAECSKVCNYIDLPLQHASDPVLRRMKRPGTRASYERLLARIRDRVPGVALRTTFIVGFPGETEADVAALLAFVEATAFEHVGVFAYSHEEGTTAFELADDVPAEVKEERRGQVMALQQSIVERRHRDRIGTRARLLVDGPAPEHELVLRGRLESQAPDIDSGVFLTEAEAGTVYPGALVEVEIVGADGYDLVARPV
ncbi:MAG: 30S ribosomal protein S12 methylthiotransferase RimO [Vicinamibacterales bacterium]